MDRRFSPRTPAGDRWGGPARKTLGGMGWGGVMGNWTQTPGKTAVTTNTALCPRGPDPGRGVALWREFSLQ